MRRGRMKKNKMKFTKYFLYIIQRPDHAKIKMEWVEETIKNPDCKEIQEVK